MSSEEARLLNALQSESSKAQAFQELMEQYQRQVYTIIRRMLINHEDTDDAVQETFIKAWKAIDTFKGNSGLFTWLYRIASNEALQTLRKRKRRFLFPVEGNEYLVDQLESNSSLDGDVVQLKLQKAILKLPDKQRLVFNLKYFDDLTYDQIVEVVGGTVGSLKASYHHAVKKIEEFVLGD